MSDLPASPPPPLPSIDADSAPFWEGTRARVLRIQVCTRCGHRQFYPRIQCVLCFGPVVWMDATGRGRIYSYTVVHRAPSEAFATRVPYVIALVDLVEGVRMMGRLRGTEPASVRIDMDVTVVFERLTEEIAIPVFESSG